jgi:4-diphosphocytidyl-2-C-methyl-D-erythritol kinase
VIRFPNCKINIGLYVVAKRNDGFHDLATVFYPVQLHDALELITTPPPGLTTIDITGLNVNGEQTENLCYKAWQMLKNDHPRLAPINFHLHKVIPMGAGLGGGSSDGAATLMLINDKYQLGLGSDQLAAYALRLGSDCPFFIYNKPCFASGRGENMIPADLDLSAYSIVIIHTGIHISTAVAFSGISPAPPSSDLLAAIRLPPAEWKTTISNDFEPGAIKTFPVLGEIKNWLYEMGALYASMTGTGSAFYGIFNSDQVPTASPRNDWQLFKAARL